MKRKLFFISILLIFCITIGYFYNELNWHISANNFSEKFAKKANKNQKYLYFMRQYLDPSFRKNVIVIPVSSIAIDIVIPLVEKDLPTVVYTIDSVRKLVNHKIGKIYLVAPNQEEIKTFAKENHCEFIDENTVLPSFQVKKFGGWVIQQFIKLNMEHIVEHDHYLVIDADTFFIRPVVFNTNNRYLINAHWDCSFLRKRFTAKLLKNKRAYVYDFVPHHMLFSKKILKQMKNHLETTYGKKWHEAIVQLLEEDKANHYGFSEYEIYVTYLTEFTTEKFRFVSNANITVFRNFLYKINNIIRAYASDYKTISMHEFIKFE